MFRIENGREHFYQYDLNQRLIIDNDDITQIHFCNRTDDCSLVVEVYEENGKRFADVPNVLLLDDWNIKVYAYCPFYTVVSTTFKVMTRTKPADYVYTETEVLTYEALEERIKALEENGIEASVDLSNYYTKEETREAVEQATETALTEAKNSGVFDGADGYTPIKGIDYFDGVNGKNGADGKDGYTPQKGIDYFDGKDGVNGKDGYTPVKGVDYFDGVNGKDGANGYTPIKGVDYFDGVNGKDGVDGKNGIDGKTPVKGVDYFDGVDGKDGYTPVKGEDYFDGVDGYTPVKGVDYFTEEDKAEIVEDVKSSLDGIPDYWQTHLHSRVIDIRKAMSDAGRNKSSFLWYTDSHWTANYKQSPNLLKYLYKNTPINKVNFGGDIVQDEPTNDGVDDTIEMSYIYEWRRAVHSLNHHSVVGNHDDGSVVNNRFSEDFVYSFLLAPEENNCIVYGDGVYYYIDDNAEKTRYLYLDTAYQMANTQQIGFVVNALNTTPENWHIVAISHIWHDALWSEEQGDYIGDYSESASKFLQLFYAYNHRQSGTVLQVDFNFTDCKGKFEFCIGGHAHWDYTSYYNDEILVILTETDSTRERVNITAVEGTITENSVNAIVADYNNNVVSVIRVGRGESRVEELRSALPATYTNVLLSAVDKDGTIFNDCGYKADTRYSNSGGGFVSASGVTCTGLIATSPNTERVIRLKNVRMNINDTASNVCHCLTFSGTPDSLVYYGTMNGANMVEHYSAVTDEEGNIVQFTIPANEGTTYMVLNTAYIGADSIITINEPID